MRCPTCGHDNPAYAQFCGNCGTPISVPTPRASEVGTTELPMVEFGTAIKLGFQRYIDFTGRSARAEFWWWLLFLVVANIVLSFADKMTSHNPTFGPIGGELRGLFILATLIPSLAVLVRRLHDINRTGWWLLLGLVLVIGWVVLLVWTNERGNNGANKYGPDPRRAT